MYCGVPTTMPVPGEPLAGLTQRRVGQRARDAEVGDERAAIGREQHVLGLDVAVEHAVLVRVMERGGHFARDPDRLVERQLMLAPEPVAQALALDVRHREPELAGGVSPES